MYDRWILDDDYRWRISRADAATNYSRHAHFMHVMTRPVTSVIIVHTHTYTSSQCLSRQRKVNASWVIVGCVRVIVDCRHSDSFGQKYRPYCVDKASSHTSRCRLPNRNTHCPVSSSCQCQNSTKGTSIIRRGFPNRQKMSTTTSDSVKTTLGQHFSSFSVIYRRPYFYDVQC